jgi:hypothetical protein
VSNHVIRVRWSAGAASAGSGVHYLAHREEPLSGRVATLYGIGPRYEAVGPDETALAQLLEQDAADLQEARYYRAKLTVDDSTARCLAALRPSERERLLRHAVRAALRKALPRAQGVFVLHFHGGSGRPWGHPHSHVHLSPRQQTAGRARVRADDIQRLRNAWANALRRALERETQRKALSSGRTRTHAGAAPQVVPTARRALQPAGAVVGAAISRLRRMTDDDEIQGPRP